MKILIIHQHFRTPEEGGAVRSFYLAEGLFYEGNKVAILTTHNHKDFSTKVINGIEVHYLPVKYDNSYGFFKRIKSFLKFTYLVMGKRQLVQKYDLCYAISTPLTVGLAGLYYKMFFNKTFIFEVGDLWPEAPIQMGIIRNPLIKSILYKVEYWIYQKADKIIALSPPIRDWIHNKINKKEKVEMITNMADIDFFKKEEKKQNLLRKYQAEKKFVVTYLGAAGKANNLDYLVNLAEYCNNRRPEIKFIIMSEGSELTKIRDRSESFNNISFIDFGGKEKVREVLNITDAVYISYLKVPVLNTGSPNKFFDGLASGKLIITNFEGWIKDLIEKYNCGFSYDPDNPREFISCITDYLDNCNLLEGSKMRARKLAEKRFAKDKMIHKLNDTLKEFN